LGSLSVMRIITHSACSGFSLAGAVSLAAAAGYEERLLRLPPFLRGADASTSLGDVIDGLADVVLGDDPPVECGPGTVIRIPPKLEHAVYAKGDRPLRVIVLYSPPLGPRVELPAD